MTESRDPAVGFLGEGSRLTQPPSEALAAATFAYELQAAPWLWRELSIADLAHTRELLTAGIVDAETGTGLLRSLLSVHEVSHDEVALDPMVGDLYNNRDKWLRDRFGADIGRIHTGRARREATTLAWQLRVRSQLVQTAGAVADLASALLETAEAHRASLMPDFTYLQHAHPTTLAHYLLGFAYGGVRDLERLEASLDLINRSPAGSGSVNGSRFPIDRHRLARTLDFPQLITHTRDAMWAPDLPLRVLSDVMIVMTTVDRLAEELQIWATAEFGFVTLADRHCRTSVIMPQKKNPYSLAMLRGHARAVLGDLVAVAATNLTPSGQPDNRVASYERVPVALDVAAACARLLAEVLREAEFSTDRMAAQAGEGFAYATDVCDHLVLETGIDNRSAHRIVGAAVRLAMARGDDVLRSEDLAEAAASLGVAMAPVSDEELARERDLHHLLALRTTTGGAGDLDAMMTELHDALDAVPDHQNLIDFEARFLDDTRRSLKDPS